MDCKICKLHNDQIPRLIESSDNWILRHSEKEKNCQGYLYLEPRVHVESFTEISSDAWAEQGIFIQKGIDWIYQNYKPLKVYIITVSEAVPHIHFHLVPRYVTAPKGIEYIELALSGRLGY